VNTLVATDGVLDPDFVVEALSRFCRDDDKVMVFTAINVPSDFLRGLGAAGIQGAATIAHEAGATLGAGDRSAERLMPVSSTTVPRDSESPMVSALAATAHSRTRPIMEALKEKGIKAKALWQVTDNRTAKTILTAAKVHDADLIVIGSHGAGKYEGLLGSTGTKLVRRAKANVLVLRNPANT